MLVIYHSYKINPKVDQIVYPNMIPHCNQFETKEPLNVIKISDKIKLKKIDESTKQAKVQPYYIIPAGLKWTKTKVDSYPIQFDKNKFFKYKIIYWKVE